MKLIIQIPCLNEEETLAVTVADLPTEIPGIDTIEYLVIDDGSSDKTQEVAKACGVHHIVGFNQNRGLARAFMLGINSCLDLGADIIVNTDADNQYCGADIPKLVEPILKGEADMVIGDRETHNIDHFSNFKKYMQRHGSFVAGHFSGLEIPDATSGFRAFSRNAALDLNVVSDFSYTLETLIQAGRKRLAVVSVPIRTNEKLRESRLFKSMFQFMRRSAATMIRVYTTHEPLKVFISIGAIFFLIGIFPIARFIYFVVQGDSGGHIQSLILGSSLLILSAFMCTIGLLADMITANRKMIEEVLRRERDNR